MTTLNKLALATVLMGATALPALAKDVHLHHVRRRTSGRAHSVIAKFQADQSRHQGEPGIPAMGHLLWKSHAAGRSG